MLHTHTPDEGKNAHYLDQLCMVGVCAALGVVSILLYVQGSLTILAEVFQVAVLIGGIALLLVAAVRGVSLWRSGGQPHDAHQHHAHDHAHGHQHHHDHEHPSHDSGHDHAHEHGAACAHDHAHPPEPAAAVAAPHGHGHDDHDHGWAPVRYAVLLLPITLFFLQIPNQAFNSYYNNCTVLRADGQLPPLFAVWFYGATPPEHKSLLDDTSMMPMDDKGGDVLTLNFKELSQAAFTPAQREFYEGKTGVLKGQFKPGPNDKTFTMVRMKITCCAADAIPLNVAIVSPEPITDLKLLQWIEVTGQIQFRKPRPDREDYIPVLQLSGRSGINGEVKADNNPFVY